MNFFKEEAGATSLEYALIATLIALVIIGAVTALGGNLSGLYQKISNAVKGLI